MEKVESVSITLAAAVCGNTYIFFFLVLAPLLQYFQFFGFTLQGWNLWLTIPPIILLVTIFYFIYQYFLAVLFTFVLSKVIYILLVLIILIFRVLILFLLPAIMIGLGVILSYTGQQAWVSTSGIIYLLLAIIMTSIARKQVWRIWAFNGLFGYVIGIFMIVAGLVEHFIAPV